MKTVKIILLIILLFAGAVFTYGCFEARRLKVDAVQFADPDVPDKFWSKTIVFASDFHCGIFFGPARMAETVERINQLHPDIVILGGDYVDYDPGYAGSCIGELKNIHAEYGVFGILGNHDYTVGIETIKKALVSASVTVLDNRAEMVNIGGQAIRIGGVDDFLRGHANLEPVLEGANDADFVILGAHNPTYAQKITGNGIDLVLSGHTHGGQVTFFGLWAPVFHFKYGQKYRSGTFRVGDTAVIVSNGVGTTYLPVRIFAEPEINVIELKTAK